MIMMIRARWSSSSLAHYTKHTDLIEKEFTKRLQKFTEHRITERHKVTEKGKVKKAEKLLSGRVAAPQRTNTLRQH